MKTPESWAGLAIRLPLEANKSLENLARSLAFEAPSLNRVASEMLLEGLELARSSQFLLDADGLALLGGLRADGDPKPELAKLATIDIAGRTPNLQTKIIKLPLIVSERERLDLFRIDLRWSANQVALEAIQAFVSLAGAVRPLTELPPLIRAWRALQIYKSALPPQTERLDLERLNQALGLVPGAKKLPKAVTAQRVARLGQLLYKWKTGG